MKINKLFKLAIVLCMSVSLSFCTSVTPQANSNPETKKQLLPIAPLDLRRTTLIVGDTERSLKFYRDALGMIVIYDKEINNPRGASVEDADIARRLVFLRANDDRIGVLGLLEYVKPRKPQVDLTGTAFHEGTTVQVYNTTQQAESIAKAKEIPGVIVVDEPEIVEYPSYDNTTTIRVSVATLQDPDGFTVELNEVLSEIR